VVSCGRFDGSPGSCAVPRSKLFPLRDFSGPAVVLSALRRLQSTAIDNDRLAGAEAGLHQIQISLGDVLGLADTADRETRADAGERRQPLGLR
jgi:hypothetical protein